MQKIMTGKVKEVFATNMDVLEFAYTDNISVFDKVIPVSIPHKGESLCRTAKFWFNILNKEGIYNHYLSEPAKDKMDVRRVQVIRDYFKIDTDTRNYLIPLEIICRHYVAGTLMDRIKKGKINATDLGFPVGHVVKYGEKLPCPFVEATTKLEATDRFLTDEKAKKMAGLTDAEYEQIRKTTLRIDEIIAKEADKRGLIHCDGKKEYAFDGNRKLMVVDTFGTLDEDRWWDAGEYAKGNIVELSKEFVRQFYRDNGYHKALYDAREQGAAEPPIPVLSQEIIDKISKLYVDMYERITGEKF